MAYRGRFAPSPTGPLHFGSLIAAVGSYLDAKHAGGTWLIRIEDLDLPRCVPDAADRILRTLDGYGLHSDEKIVYQSLRTEAYEAALSKLQSIEAVYPCACTRREIADSAIHRGEELIYPGTCRSGLPENRKARSWRVSVDSVCVDSVCIGFEDRLCGHIEQDLASSVGDFVVRRADGLFAYQLAVVVDDAFQGITDVVRGADLIGSTARQIHLQRLLNLPTPSYMHLPVAVNEQGEKLSKQTLASPAKCDSATLIDVLEFLQQRPPEELRTYPIDQILQWAIENWNPETLRSP